MRTASVLAMTSSPEPAATTPPDPAAIVRSKSYVVLLVFAALIGIPVSAIAYFFLAAVIGLAAIGDVRIMRFGLPRGGPRLARHLWRMCFALFIAAGSFFSIRARVAKILPEPFTTAPMRALPILLVFGAMFYWLWRVRSRRAFPLPARATGDP